MNEAILKVLRRLDETDIEYTCVEHPPVYTLDEILALNLPHSEAIACNLLIRDKNKKNYYLLSVQGEKRTNFKELQSRLGSKPLHFASENDLEALLGVKRGSVSPFGVFNDTGRRTKVLIDAAFQGRTIAIHPNDNRATVWLPAAALMDLLRQDGHSVEFIQL